MHVFLEYFFQVSLTINLVTIWGQSYFHLKYSTWVVPFRMTFVTSLVVLSVVYKYIYPIHATHSNLYVDGSTISHIINV